MYHPTGRAWLAAALGILVTIARAQPSVALSGQVELARLVDLASERLGISIDYDAATLKGSVTLRLSGQLKDAQLWDLTNQVLAQRGFTTVRAAGAAGLSVVRLADAAQTATLGASPPGAAPGFSTTVLELKHRTPKEIAEALKAVLSRPNGAATPLGDSKMLIVSDLSARVPEVEAIVARLDVPAEAFVIEPYRCEHVSPAELATVVGQIAAKRDPAAGGALPGQVIAPPGSDSLLVLAPKDRMAEWTGLIARLDQRQPVEARNYVPRRFTAAEVAKLLQDVIGSSAKPEGDRARVVVDQLTGTLIVTATAADHERVRALLERLDAADPAVSRRMRAFPIRNRPVAEIQQTLSQLIDSGVLDQANADINERAAISAAGRQGTVRSLTGAEPGAAPAVPSPANPVPPLGGPPRPQAAGASGPENGVTLTADEQTNMLIAVGDARMLAQLADLILLLDVRQPQVMLEVMLVSVNDSDSLHLGVELERLGNVGDAAYKLASLFGLGAAGIGGRVPAESSGFTGAVLDPGEFSVIVKALQTINKGHSLSNPKLLVSNNEQATFSSVLQQPVLTTTSSNTSTIAGYGGTEDAGTTVSVKPQIAQGDHLILTYSINLSSFVGTSAGNGLPPPKQQNGVNSVATIPDGHVVVVGGLELFSDSKGTSQVPGLGDIPLVGEAFKDRIKNVSRTRFFVFIKATVLRHQNFEDLKYISTIDAASVGVDDGFPRVKPRIIR